eukprot:TRINITY_DN80888_c0_g1_i1.p1 TRINITY_DN80888_c0_g1~~TRINITY_DN80888_c0_g1_i1.p1  ORF type:complete len:557 (-),score=84.24 TRINITY_DN80888_c0_g1_i1:32-1702(-)
MEDAQERLLPPSLTALSADFPKLLQEDLNSICFNIRPGDLPATAEASYGSPGGKVAHLWTDDPYFHWQGSYMQLRADSEPCNDVHREALASLANVAGFAEVKKFRSQHLSAVEAVFYSPAKAHRFGGDMLGPARRTASGEQQGRACYAENILVRRDGADSKPTWWHIELPMKRDTTVWVPDGDALWTQLPESCLQRITYPAFILDDSSGLPPGCCATPSLYAEACSESAWLDGSSLLRLKSSGCGGHLVEYVPDSFTALRFVPLQKRDAWLKFVATEATFALTGATLCKGSPFASPLSREVAECVGEQLALQASESSSSSSSLPRLMASASLRTHSGAMSADNDFTCGFERGPGCRTVSFKGSNAVWLHGNAWVIPHGTAYLLEEALWDFTNHAKEAALMASATNPGSIALLAGGGPTVACNLVRMLMLCSPRRVFAVNGLHSAFGSSGAAGSFGLDKEQLRQAIVSLSALAPSFFEDKAVVTAEQIQAALRERPLLQLNLADNPLDTACEAVEFNVQANVPNASKSPGLTEEQRHAVAAYAIKCAQLIAEASNGA